MLMLISMRTLATKILFALCLPITMAQSTFAQDRPLKIGTKVGPTAQIFEVVQQEAAKQGLNLDIVIFNDMTGPLVALALGDLDASCYTSQTRVDKVNAEGYKHKLVTIAKTSLFPLGIYSKKIKHLRELPQNARFGLPNDPVNSGRVLLLLQEQGIIKLDPAAGLEASPMDVIENPKQIQFIELDSAQMPRSLDDTDAAGINSNYAIEAGLVPSKDALVLEAKTGSSGDSPYVVVFVTREQDQHRHEWKQILDIYRGPVVTDFILSGFKGSIIP